MTLLDWLIVIIPSVVVLWAGLRTQRYVRGVSDFMAGGRLAGRYLIAVSEGVAAMGLIYAVAQFEFYYESGFAVEFWGAMGTPVWLLITIVGFVIYRFRETRAMTLAQFLEVRYSRNVRIFAGVLAAVSGIVNFGLFPAVAGRFFIYYCDLPPHVQLFGFAVPTFALAMASFLSVALLLVNIGGQLTIMVTDCVQGLFTYIMCLVVIAVAIYLFRWDQMSGALLDRPVGKSMLNPFDIGTIKDFNIWFVIIGILGGVYSTMAWQGNMGSKCSASSAHEAKMAGIIGAWRTGAITVMFTVLTICAYTYLHRPEFAEGAAQVNARLSQIDSPQIQMQMRVPVALSHMLPVGIKGMFLTVMLFLMLTTDVAYLHSWGSIVIQDVVLPFRRTPFTPKQHLRLLRTSIAGVAVFAFIFSLFFNQTTYIFMFFALTGSIYLGGAGAMIIGGLYWKKGTAAGAWAAMILGALVAILGFIGEQAWQSIHAQLLKWMPQSEFLLSHAERFPINGQWIWFTAMASAVLSYVVISLITNRGDFNMDRMLHRGAYARDEQGNILPQVEPPPRTWRTFLGIDEKFTRGDKLMVWLVFSWSMGLFAVWGVVAIWNVLSPWPEKWWASYFWIRGIWVVLIVGAVTSVWFMIGGTRDLLRLFAKLRTHRVSTADDGRVIGNVNADDLAEKEPVRI